MTATYVILAPVTILAALGLLVVRKAVHAALCLAVVMIGLAILMLFLFVLMLVGVDTTESLRETIGGQKALAGLFGLVLGILLVVGVVQASLGTMKGLASANAGGNVKALADLLFSRYVVAFEATSALLITAAIGAMVLAHRERLEPKATQADLAQQRLRELATRGRPLGPLPPPGTFARHNANDTPALLPDGTTADSSVPALLGGGRGVSTGSTSVSPTGAGGVSTSVPDGEEE